MQLSVAPSPLKLALHQLHNFTCRDWSSETRNVRFLWKVSLEALLKQKIPFFYSPRFMLISDRKIRFMSYMWLSAEALFGFEFPIFVFTFSDKLHKVLALHKQANSHVFISKIEANPMNSSLPEHSHRLMWGAEIMQILQLTVRVFLW